MVAKRGALLGRGSHCLVPAVILREGNQLSLQLLDQSCVGQVELVENVDTPEIQRVLVRDRSAILMAAPEHNADLVILIRNDLRLRKIQRCPEYLLNIRLLIRPVVRVVHLHRSMAVDQEDHGILLVLYLLLLALVESKSEVVVPAAGCVWIAVQLLFWPNVLTLLVELVIECAIICSEKVGEVHPEKWL